MTVTNDRNRLNRAYIDIKREELNNFNEIEIEKNKAKMNFDIY